MTRLLDLFFAQGHRLPGVLALSLALVGAPHLAQAHHSFAMYDQTKIVTLNGTVRAFQ